MRTIFCAVFLSSLAANASAEPVSRPTFTPNDTWSYHLSVQSGGTMHDSHITVSVTRVGSDSVLVAQQADTAMGRLQSKMFGLDWSMRRSVNGQETTVNQPFSFPLDVGKTWRVEYIEQNPTAQKLRELDSLPYKVVGWEDVTVPAGKFRALKIESDGRWTAEISPRVINNAIISRQGALAAQTSENRVVRGARVSGRFYKCFWYVPEVKRWVKSIEENYNAGGALNQSVTDELESYNVDGANKLEATTPAPVKPVQPPAPAPAGATPKSNDAI